MRELVVENQRVLIIPQDFKCVNEGTVKSVSAGDFVLELDCEPNGILVNNYCEFYTQTKHGKLYFDSYAKSIDGKNLVIASPAKHKFLQRRQYTRIKFVGDTEMTSAAGSYKIHTLDISAGGMKLSTSEKIDIDSVYELKVKVSDTSSIKCYFHPIRVEKQKENEGYLISGQFTFDSNKDKMMLVQYCAKRNVEIKNK